MIDVFGVKVKCQQYTVVAHITTLTQLLLGAPADVHFGVTLCCRQLCCRPCRHEGEHSEACSILLSLSRLFSPEKMSDLAKLSCQKASGCVH
jgi:hypothetical protein